MATVDRRGKSIASAWGTIADNMPPEDYNVAYAMWKMGASAEQLAEQYNVNGLLLDYSFELRLIHESNE